MNLHPLTCYNRGIGTPINFKSVGVHEECIRRVRLPYAPDKKGGKMSTARGVRPELLREIKNVEDIAKEAKLSEKDVSLVLTTLIMRQRKRQRTEADKIIPQGGIPLLKASRKYRIPKSTISNWVKKGQVKVLYIGKNYTYLSEEDIQILKQTYIPGSRGRKPKTLKNEET